MKKVYLIPNLFTTANVFCGVLAIIFILESYTSSSPEASYRAAAFIIILAMVFDFIDGQVARLYRATSRFGIEYDSLADFLTFGIATAFLIYRMYLSQIHPSSIGIGLTFLYIATCALRLARFNTQVDKEEKEDFVGLPSPVSAGVLISLSLIITRYEALGFLIKAIPFIMFGLAYMMVSTYIYPSLLTLQIRRKKPFVYLVAAALGLTFIIFFREIGLFLVYFSYLSLGLVQAIRLKKRKKEISGQEMVSSKDR